jgi:XTP/dITP diphosphohydrolase
VLLATNNAGKVSEMIALLAPAGWTPLTPRELGINLDVPETGSTYAENATIKATAFARASGILSLADDSGLEVEALGGRPGVHSARYCGEATPHSEKIRLLLAELDGTPENDRAACFRSVIAIATPDGETWLAEGSVAGRIADAPRGSNGFGYDPIFLVPQRGLTFAEIGEDEKNRISHRAVALRGALAVLDRLLRTGEGL